MWVNTLFPFSVKEIWIGPPWAAADAFTEREEEEERTALQQRD